MSNEIGLIGVGLLGQAMAERLLADGFDVHGFDVREDLESFESTGGTICESAAQLAERCPRILLCLPDSNVVGTVISQIEPTLSHHILIDTTTGAPADTIAFGERLAELGCIYMDATVAGSSQQMRQHAATIMVGGTPEAFDSCRDIFAALSAKTYHVGEAGSGARMKLVVNLAIGLHRAVLAETLAFGESMGFGSQQVVDVLRNTPAYSAAMDTKAAKMVDEDFQPQARLQQHLKDVRLILAAAHDHDAIVPLSKLHADLLDKLVAAGFGDLDNSAVVKAFRK